MGRFMELYYPEHLKGDLDEIRDLGHLTGEHDDLEIPITILMLSMNTLFLNTLWADLQNYIIPSI